MTDVSVAICTYNGESRIGAVLERLRSQVNPGAVVWEIIVVDNNSTDGTKQTVERYCHQWESSVPLRYVFEREQGLALARSRAVLEASGTWVCFLDDDTLPAQDWLKQAAEFGKSHPQVGAFGGQIHGDYEVEPPPEFNKIAVFLAVIERGAKPYRYEPRARVLPPGAGLAVRRQAWLDVVPKKPVLLGRVSGVMLASEDIEALAHLQKAGWEVWYNPEMHLYHQIPQWRTEKRYLFSLIRGIGFARSHIRMVRLSPWQRPLFLPLYLLNDLKRVVVHVVKYRALVTTDLAIACEMQYLVSSLLSPFYLWFHTVGLK
ncbi:hormogonium polysaccharide biosynthesis glycosyltransferase HpsE [Myxacorys almedinensis]|uniref:Glycosyltransferase n=1 Tax=Myxacorys almedinensis A TaxID=2690445 RepID=A0A8J7Z566_9CYAN|nr:hormogonium polysaccharide biosynthesis glycosyltransferase HpsE [Myxacorys almedinensis]NDJ15720.1 glycosyltransferase [Myxacorys almedinensis A]